MRILSDPAAYMCGEVANSVARPAAVDDLRKSLRLNPFPPIADLIFMVKSFQ
jgi:hypothetical protein